MHNIKRHINALHVGASVVLACLFGLLPSAAALANNPSSMPMTQAQQSDNWEWWPSVGSASLTWGFWKIYDSELRTPSGEYHSEKQPIALVITYSRDIDGDDLLEATVEQWEHLGITKQEIVNWLPEMKGKWPNVREGDRLIYVLNNNAGTFYYQPFKGAVTLSGQLDNADLANAFSDIWLSPGTSYPSIRLALIGSKPQ
ncbi:hypothetical protein LRP49_00420 [Enterovibrio sp. ZSDZ35]|uniref:Chalcone isomerase-like n=1 Tax=Enterovibrio qingdaonensis TaxID=2899818 RepID=A0ABT5QFL5_9GAMM|nr:hypothetical protein [Enterovibrio sp. ZSDZ35]MDD1779644.1 hypothetical protein [Enterovibrio sp. ZSDZ35]